MGDPMPTVISKGYAGYYFDQKYASPANRWHDLHELRDNGAGLVPTLLAGLPAAVQTAIQPELAAWFSTAANKWNFFRIDNSAPAPSYAVEDVTSDLGWANLEQAEANVKEGIIRALEVSLSLGIGQSPTVVTPMHVPTRPRPRGPLKLHWVCGKGDGFDVQVTWTHPQVDCFIITPPIRLPVAPLANSWHSSTVAGLSEINDAMRTDDTGMLIVSSPTIAKLDPTTSAVNPVLPPLTALMGLPDGGLTPWP